MESKEVYYLGILKSSKNILSELGKKDELLTWSQLRKRLAKEISNDNILKKGIDQLIELNLIKKDGEGRGATYKINERYGAIARSIGSRDLDKRNLDEFNSGDIINFWGPSSFTTIYGLKSGVFYKQLKDGKPDTSLKETREFASGIKAIELMGERYATPPEILLNDDATDEEIRDAEIEYYSKLLKESKNPKKVIKSILEKYRDTKVEFKYLGANIVEKITGMKKEHRFSELEKTYKELLKEVDNIKIKRFLKDNQKEIISLLNKTGSKEEIERTLFIHRDFLSPILFSFDSKRLKSFSKSLDKLTQTEKEWIIIFLLKIVNKNKDLYPTRISVFIKR
ncbi:MAG: hypothetical protein ABIH28_00520 [archaeon]